VQPPKSSEFGVETPFEALLNQPAKSRHMATERETVVEIAVSVVSVGLFIAVIVGIGSTYNSDGLTNAGALALIGAIAGFVVLMSLVAYFLAGR
jgi:hypothetical protein